MIGQANGTRAKPGLAGRYACERVFDLNDFDETLPGPWEWDVKRSAASFAIAGRDRNSSIKDFHVRQLRDWMASANIERMPAEGMEIYGRMCAWPLARTHGRSGDRIAIATYLGNATVFDEAIGDFAKTYADQNECDFSSFKEAISSGRITAANGCLSHPVAPVKEPPAATI
jgi:hypothetical protein